jgi:hypothetical protein
MTLSSLLSVLWRQRLLVIPAAIAAALLCVAVVVKSPPTYRASGSVVLLNPPTLPQAQLGGATIPADWQNPYARIGSLAVVVDLMVRVLGSDAVQAKLAAAGFQGTEEVAGNRDFYSGPIVDLAAEASSGSQAIADVNLLIDEFNRQLQILQDQQGTAREYHIRSETVISANRATTVFSGTLRLLLVTMFSGMFLVVGTGIVADRLRTERRRSPSTARSPAVAHVATVAHVASRPTANPRAGILPPPVQAPVHSSAAAPWVSTDGGKTWGPRLESTTSVTDPDLGDRPGLGQEPLPSPASHIGRATTA